MSPIVETIVMGLFGMGLLTGLRLGVLSMARESENPKRTCSPAGDGRRRSLPATSIVGDPTDP